MRYKNHSSSEATNKHPRYTQHLAVFFFSSMKHSSEDGLISIFTLTARHPLTPDCNSNMNVQGMISNLESAALHSDFNMCTKPILKIILISSPSNSTSSENFKFMLF